MGWLYRYEAKGIQGFITQTDKLREIKGGSNLIASLPELLEHVLKSDVLPGDNETIVAAAGSATVRFSDKAAVELMKSVWPMLVDRWAPGLDVIQAAVDEDAEGKAQSLLMSKLRSARNRFCKPLPEAVPVVFRAPRSGLPAVPFNADERELRDRALSRRATAGDDGQVDSTGRRLDPGLKYALDLEHDMPGSYLAVVHADGNDLGAKIMNLDKGEIKAFSEALKKATEAAAKTALATVKSRLEESLSSRGRVAFRPIVLGGDDLTVIIRADLAIDFTVKYLEAFEAETQGCSNALKGPVTACAGIAYVHNGYPFHRAHELAEQLCSYAKDKLRRVIRRAEAPNLTASGINWHRLSTSLSGEYEKDIVKGELSVNLKEPEDASPAIDGGMQRNGVKQRCLAGGPYTIRQIKDFPSVRDLIGLSRLLGKASSGPIRTSIDMMMTSPGRARKKWDRFRHVSRQDGLMFETFFEKLGCDKYGWFKKPDKDNVLKTPLLDAWVLKCVSECGVR